MAKSLYTRRLGKIVADSALREGEGNYHVISGVYSKWAVLREGRMRSLRNFSNRREAVGFAKQMASKRSGLVIVHEQTGLVKEKISYAGK